MTITDKELAEELDKLKGTGRELEGFVPVPGKGTKTPRSVLSIRMSSEELHRIEKAATGVDENVSEFIRNAALARTGQYQALTSVRLKETIARLRSLVEVLEGLQSALPEAFSGETGDEHFTAVRYRERIATEVSTMTDLIIASLRDERASA